EQGLRQAGQGGLQVLDAGDGSELRQLAQELTVFHWLEWVLVLELGDHQAQELFLAERVVRLAPRRLSCDSGDTFNHVLTPHWPMRSVCTSRSREVVITSTLFW